MSKKRLYEIAKELGKESKEVVTRAKELGFDVKSHASSVDTDVAEKLIKSFAAKKETVEKKVAEVAAKTTAVAEKKEAAPVKKEGATETKSVTPAAKPKSRHDSHHKEFLDDFSRFTLDAFCDFGNRHSIRILKFTW